MHLSLRSRWILTTVALLSTLIAVLSWRYVKAIEELVRNQTASQRRRAEAEGSRFSSALVRRLAAITQRALLDQDFRLSQETMTETTREEREVLAAFLTDAEGLVVAHSDTRQLGRPLADRALLALSDKLAARGELTEPDPRRPRVLIYARRFTFSGVFTGTVWVEYSLERQFAEMAAGVAELRAHAERAIWSAVGLSLFVVLLGVGLVVLQTYRVTQPLRLVGDAAARIAGGDFDHRVPVRGKHEVAQLGARFNDMAAQLGRYVDQATAQAMLDRELQLARTIQQTLLPPPTEWRNGRFVLAGVVETASQCGGDWWLVHAIDDRRTLVVVADVTGHGISAAIIMATAIGACEAMLGRGQDLDRPDEVLRLLNRSVTQARGSKMAMTCCASVIDAGQGVVRVANAGHTLPLLQRRSQGAQGAVGFPSDRRCTPIVVRGPRLGDDPQPTFLVKELPLERDDLLVWHTDGIVDRRGASQEFYGQSRFMRAIVRGEAEHASPALVRDGILADVKAFGGDEALEDDLTLVVGRLG